ncbi:MAG: CPBP family intramembrane metalloprotease [Candidatus Marinimicrobia bacterium]|nr:CPBP family intramembrane metalloprotease [Candidatus Neomarinimicrobiota bacterium]
MSWPALRDRFRLNRMERKGWLWTIGLFLFMLITAGLLSVLLLSIIPGLVEKGVLTISDSTPSFIDPRIPQGLESMKNQMGAEAVGNWSLLVITFFSLILNILGEEFLWRGYVLPRQELTYGKRTWMVHGVLWTLLHAFKWWQMLALLPGALALSFVAQRFQNTWPGIIAHFVTNGIGMIGVLLVVMGAGA